MVSIGERFGLTAQPDFVLSQDEGGMIKVTRRSIFSQRLNTMELPIDLEMFQVWRSGGGLVQDVFPQLNADQREFLMTGATPEEWARITDDCGEDDPPLAP
jgi:hypothetical protein